MRKSLFFILVLYPVLSWAQWRQTAGPTGGNVYTIVVDGTNILAGTSAGVFLSGDEGQTWVIESDGLPDTPIYSVLISSSSFFAGTYGNGVYRSVNGGSNWMPASNGLTNPVIRSLAKCGTRLLAGSDAGLFISTDNAENWIHHPALGLSKVYAFTMMGSTVFAATNGTGVHYSPDSGITWHPMNNGLTNLNVLSLAADGDVLFAGLDGGGIFRHTGSEWHDVNNGISGQTVVTALTVSSSGIFAGTYGSGIYRTTDHGNQWQPVNNLPFNPVIHCLGNTSSKIFAGSNGGGIFYSADQGDSWLETNQGLLNSGIKSMMISGSDIYAGTWGAGIFHSAGNGYEWSSRNNGLQSCFISSILKIGDLLLAGTMGSGFYMSEDNGYTWNTGNYGLSNPYVSALASDGIRLFAGTEGGGVFFSADTGKQWSAVNNGMTDLNITTLAISQGKVYAGTRSEGVFISSMNEIQWEPVNYGLNDLQINTLSGRGAEIYAGTISGVYCSYDQAQTWNPVKSGLPGFSITSVGFCNESIFAATEENGIFVLTCRAEDWKKLNTGLADSSVQTLVLNSLNVFAGTRTRGVWICALSDIFTLETNPDTVVLNWDTGNSMMLTINTCVEWSLQGYMPDWLAVSKTNGLGSDTLIFTTLKPNTTTKKRQAVLYLFSPKAKTVTFTVSQKGETDAIEDLQEDFVTVFPNPTSGTVTIRSLIPPEKIVIFNTMGAVVKEINKKATEHTIVLSDAGGSIFYLSLFMKDGVISRKLVLTR